MAPNDPNAPADPKLHFPATGRNREAIAEVLAGQLEGATKVLEIASGSGEHITFFARHFTPRFPELRWQPSDIEAEHLASIAAWTDELGLEGQVAPPVRLDVHDEDWGVDGVDFIFCANMIHIAPETAAPALLRGAAERLPPGGRLVLYGPFKRQGAHTAESNLRFDESLKSRDARWGVRDLDDLAEAALSLGLELQSIVDMPANNFTAIFVRRDP